MRRGQMWMWGVLIAASLWPAVTTAQVLFYTDTHQPSPAIRRCGPTGNGLVTMPLPASSFPEGIAYDGVNNQLYWVEASYSGARIRRSNGGLGPGTTVLSGLGSLRGLAVHGGGGKLYWTSSDQGVATINRANLDGTAPEVLLQLPGYNPRQIAIDLLYVKLYWTEFELDALMRCNLDGTVAEYAQLAAGSRPYGIAVDATRNVLWWSTYGHGQLTSVPMPAGSANDLTSASDGAEAQDLEARSAVLISSMREKRSIPMASQITVGDLPNITHLAVDEPGGRVFFTQATTLLSGGLVRRIGIDGLGLATLPVTEQAFGGVAFYPGSLLDVPGDEPQPPTTVAWSLRAPNPARAGASIEFSLPAEGDVRLDVIDAAGRRVATLAEGAHSAGAHRVTWTGQTASGRAAPGMYIIRLESGGRRLTQRVTYLK